MVLYAEWWKPTMMSKTELRCDINKESILLLMTIKSSIVCDKIVKVLHRQYDILLNCLYSIDYYIRSYFLKSR